MSIGDGGHHHRDALRSMLARLPGISCRRCERVQGTQLCQLRIIVGDQLQIPTIHRCRLESQSRTVLLALVRHALGIAIWLLHVSSAAECYLILKLYAGQLMVWIRKPRLDWAVPTVLEVGRIGRYRAPSRCLMVPTAAPRAYAASRVLTRVQHTLGLVAGLLGGDGENLLRNGRFSHLRLPLLIAAALHLRRHSLVVQERATVFQLLNTRRVDLCTVPAFFLGCFEHVCSQLLLGRLSNAWTIHPSDFWMLRRRGSMQVRRWKHVNVVVAQLPDSLVQAREWPYHHSLALGDEASCTKRSVGMGANKSAPGCFVLDGQPLVCEVASVVWLLLRAPRLVLLLGDLVRSQSCGCPNDPDPLALIGDELLLGTDGRPVLSLGGSVDLATDGLRGDGRPAASENSMWPRLSARACDRIAGGQRWIALLQVGEQVPGVLRRVGGRRLLAKHVTVGRGCALLLDMIVN